MSDKKQKKKAALASTMCPCGRPLSYDACCGVYHADSTGCPDPESLMRSRYTAYVLGLEPYLLATWAPQTRPISLNLDAPPQPQWLGLVVLAVAQLSSMQATVTFRARYKLNGRAEKIEEKSLFYLLDGRWFYLEPEEPC